MITLIEVLEKMDKLNRDGYCSYFEGMGNGLVIPVVETWVIVNEKKEKKK